MSASWKKDETIEQMLDHYFQQCDACLALFEKTVAVFFQEGRGAAFEAAVQLTHEAESVADDLRRDIEFELYGKALLPESRGDILGLLEAFDQLPNMAQTVLFVLLCQRMTLPPEFKAAFRHLIDLNLQAYYQVRKAVDCLFHHPQGVTACTREVDPKESESDRAERAMVCDLFKTGMDMGDKMMFKELVLLIGHLSDLAKKTGDRINIISMKRQI